MRKTGESPAITGHLTGFIRVRADDLNDAVRLLAKNPTFEAGGSIEVRELPATD